MHHRPLRIRVGPQKPKLWLPSISTARQRQRYGKIILISIIKNSVERFFVILQLELAFDPLKDPQYYSLFAIFQLTLQYTTVAFFCL